MINPIVIKLGTIISKSLIKSWLNLDDTTAELSDNLIDLFQDQGIDILDQRSLTRQFDQIGDTLAMIFSNMLEHTSINSSTQELIINEVINTISKITISHQLLIEYNYNAQKLYTLLLSKSCHSKLLLNECEEQLYFQLLNYAAQYIVELAPTLPTFTHANIKEIVVRFSLVSEKINDILDRLQNVNLMVEDKNNIIKNFERDYRNSIYRKYSYINLFGANSIDKIMRKYKLSIAYVELEASEVNTSADDYLDKFNISEAFDNENILWVTGEAGSGKTTFLQWLAISAVQKSTTIPAICDLIPIVIELRKTKTWPINLVDFITMTISDTTSNIPGNWLSNLLINGDVLLLVDGLDEITEEQRLSVLDWLEELYDEFKKIKIVITSRPTVKERPRFTYFEIEILPMNMKSIECFINYWHKAILVDQIHETNENSKTISRALLDKLQYSEPIAKLATNPLLCAMICALNYKNNSVLPSNRNELYEECCKMLIDSRDVAKHVINKIELSYTVKMAILNDLAYWMLRNNKSLVSRSSAIEHLSQKLLNMGIAKTKDDVNKTLQFLIERSGVLREPEIGCIDFIHKTFQEYMAAKEISMQGDWGLLTSYATTPSWYETIILSMSFANKTHADEVIQELISQGKKQPQYSKIYFLLAMLCSTSAIELSCNLRNEILKIMDNLIPPTLDDCKYLASVGELAIPFLSNKTTYSPSERIACIRTLRLCDSPKTFPIISTYLDKNIDKLVLNEIENFLFVNSPSEISSSCLGNKLIDFILSQINDNSLIISEVLLLSIAHINYIQEKLKPLSSIKKLTLTKYTGENCDLYNMFSNVSQLKLYGNFQNVDVLNYFGPLAFLGINSTNKYFDIYSLRYYNNLNHIKGFLITLNNRTYIDGSDLPMLKDVEYMQWCLQNKEIEFSFDCFSNFKHLKKILISSDFASDINYYPLENLNTLETLKIQVSTRQDAHALRQELANITKFNIEVVHK